MWNHSRIQLHAGKLQMWNRAGIVPRGHDVLLVAVDRRGTGHQSLGHSVGREGLCGSVAADS